jgi:hypothetical protein
MISTVGIVAALFVRKPAENLAPLAPEAGH